MDMCFRADIAEAWSSIEYGQTDVLIGMMAKVKLKLTF
jgi:hypothetical protein